VSIEFYTFTVDGASPDNFSHQGRFSQLSIGKVGADNFGGGTLLICKPTIDGGQHVVRSIPVAEFIILKDKTIRLELPDETEIFIELTGSTSPNLYVEHRNQKDDRA
jgi:hypothetical protein